MTFPILYRWIFFLFIFSVCVYSDPREVYPIEHTNANLSQPRGAATTIVINNMSGAIGKNEDSINATINRAGIA